MTILIPSTTTSNLPDARVLNRLRIAEVVCLSATTLIAAIILCGWLAPAVASALPAGSSLMKANTALAVLLCVASLVLTPRKQSPRLVLAGRVCASIVVLLAGAALFEHWSERITGLATFLAADSESPIPGRMSIQTASCLVLLGVSSTIDHTRQDLLGRVLDVLNAALVLFILVLLAGYVFGATSLIGQSSATRLSPQTLICITLLTVVLTNRRASYGIFSVMVGVGIGSQFARITLPSSVILSYLIISAGANLLASGTLTLPYAAAVTASGLAAVLIFLVVLLAGKMNALDSRLRDIALSDELTGLHNRRGFYLLGEQALRDSRRAAKPLTVLFFDVDGLKKINDNLGHDIGSRLLLETATLLRATFRGSDVVGRVGGDEFAVIAHGAEATLGPVLRRLNDAIEAANDGGDKPYRISVSVGMATAEPQGQESLAELLDQADTAMYQRRRQGHTAQEAGEAGQPGVDQNAGLPFKPGRGQA